MRFPQRVRGWSLLAIISLAAGVFSACNNTKITPLETYGAAPADLARGGVPTIYVCPFATNSAEVQVDPGGPLHRLMDGQPLLERQHQGLLSGLFNPHGQQENPYQTAAQVSDAEIAASNDMQAGLLKALRSAGIPAHSFMEYQVGTSPANSLMLTGQFLTIDEGQKSKRMVIGLGVGASFLETQVQLRDASRPESLPLMSFCTQGDSGMMPGAAVSGGVGAAAGGVAAVGAGVSGFRAAGSGTPRDVQHTADQIADYLKQYYQQQGWLPKPQN